MRLLLVLLALLLSGCASPNRQALGQALGTLQGEMQQLEEELAELNGLHYQKALDSPLSLRRHLAAKQAEGIGATLSDGPQLTYHYRLNAAPASGQLSQNPCLDYAFELRRLGRFGLLVLQWQAGSAQGEQRQRQSDCHWPAH